MCHRTKAWYVTRHGYADVVFKLTLDTYAVCFDAGGLAQYEAVDDF
jgi:hypothetical protein